MDTSNYFRLTVYFCFAMIIFTLSINMISAMGIFTPVDVGVDTSSNNPNAIFADIIKQDQGIAFVFGAILSVAGIGTIVIAKMLQSTSVIGIYLFSAIFWTSYSRFIGTININNFIPEAFLLIFTVALLFVWASAVVGMLTSTVA